MFHFLGQPVTVPILEINGFEIEIYNFVTDELRADTEIAILVAPFIFHPVYDSLSGIDIVVGDRDYWYNTSYERAKDTAGCLLPCLCD